METGRSWHLKRETFSRLFGIVFCFGNLYSKIITEQHLTLLQQECRVIAPFLSYKKRGQRPQFG